ncbi:hypothetical protein NDU88_005775 [Pleurodeles waltl]|uniref:Uncharacterized protein n=1 Tax=Pleurodeles waltl TaxID=8319 RepID=A0AAV7MZE4_PLEWA|nr:hypothetical protein NDU88_005775 [Pleurodeles waltl]
MGAVRMLILVVYSHKQGTQIELSHSVISVDLITTLAMSRLVQDRLGLFVKWKRKKVSIEASQNACTYFHFSPRSVLNLPEVAFLKNKRGARPNRLYKDQGSLPRKLTCDVNSAVTGDSTLKRE